MCLCICVGAVRVGLCVVCRCGVFVRECWDLSVTCLCVVYVGVVFMWVFVWWCV